MMDKNTNITKEFVHEILENFRSTLDTLENKTDSYHANFEMKLASMTQLLSHTIAHFTGPSFMLKANNQPYKNILGLVFS